jgi:nucleotide-binding universal stress UspA family protein
MFRKILVPVNFTPEDHRAVDAAIELASSPDAEVTLIHVIEPLERIPFAELESFYRRLEESARGNLARLVDRPKARGRKIHLEIIYGNRVEEIVRHAAEENADLIVMSSHPIDPSRPGKGFGTISYKVGILASCPILLMK